MATLAPEFEEVKRIDLALKEWRRGRTRQSLFPLPQCYEARCAEEKVAPLVRQLRPTQELLILGQYVATDEQQLHGSQARPLPTRPTPKNSRARKP